MRTSIFTLTLAIFILGIGSVHAQLAAKKGVTIDELAPHINKLIQNGDSTSKVTLEQEVDHMAKSNNEIFHRFAVSISSYYRWTEKAAEIEQAILSKFPNGLKARNNAFEALIEDQSSDTEQLEKQYNDWLKEYPKERYRKLIPGDNEYGFGVWSYYDDALLKLSQRLIKNGGYEQADKYIDQLKTASNIVKHYTVIGEDLLNANQAPRALSIAEHAYNEAKEQFKTASADMLPRHKETFNHIAELYARALFANDNIDRGSEIAQELFNNGHYSISNALLLVKGLSQQGRDLDAFITLENHTLKHGKHKQILQELEQLYQKLNNNNGTFSSYMTMLDNKLQEVIITNYKESLIKEETPAFSVTDQDGNTITLADLKGKVIILDFWATWCGPCINSFPGMQAAVDKYKDDEEVVFLFVNTGQREENYKDLVNKFIKDNNYTFQVVFDEMKDREKSAATALQVQGLPTKVVIDKKGYIRFKSAGASVDIEATIQEMDIKIELAKRGW